MIRVPLASKASERGRRARGEGSNGFADGGGDVSPGK
jgi:hypothetical protein